MTTSKGWQTSQCNLITDVETDNYIMACGLQKNILTELKENTAHGFKYSSTAFWESKNYLKTIDVF